MLAHRTLAGESERSRRFGWSTILLILVLATSSPVFAGTLVNLSELTDPIAAAAQSMLVIDSGVDGIIVAVGPETMLRPTPAADTLKPQAGKILKEVVKQTIDQPGHFLIGAAPIWASRYLVGVPWYGWVVTPLLAYREWLQWPSNRWWDPPLDWAFLSLGAVVATWRRRSKRRSWVGRRRIARGLSFRLAPRDASTPAPFHVRAPFTAGAVRRRRTLSAVAKAGSPR
jgi:hypothetical protein